MRRAVIGLVLLAAGAAGYLAFREPVTTYTVDIVGTGEDVGRQVDADCEDGHAVGRFAGDERAESECEAAEDSVKIGRVVKLAASGLAGVLGAGALAASGWSRMRGVRDRRSYRRMVRDHGL